MSVQRFSSLENIAGGGNSMWFLFIIPHDDFSVNDVIGNSFLSIYTSFSWKFRTNFHGKVRGDISRIFPE